MRATPLLPLCLFLAACLPAAYLTPAAGDVLPEQAQRVLDSYTATARVMATQLAGVTATDQASRATSTAAVLLTQGSLAVEQTQVALQVTQSAGVALATDAVVVRTKAAAAASTQAAVSADDRRQQLASSAGMAEFWKTVRTVFVVLLIVAGLSVITVKVIDQISRIRLAQLAGQAEAARAAFRVLAPGHWAEWQPGNGYQVYQLPGPLDEPAVIIENVTASPNKVHAFRQAVRLFGWWGDRFGFGIRDIGPEGANVVTDPVWRRLSKILKDAGVLAEVTVPGKKGRVTDWAGGWDYRRLTDDLSSGRLSLPFPIDDEAPKVAFTVPTQHHSGAYATQATRQHSSEESRMRE